jgi:hypothetical protein
VVRGGRDSLLSDIAVRPVATEWISQLPSKSGDLAQARSEPNRRLAHPVEGRLAHQLSVAVPKTSARQPRRTSSDRSRLLTGLGRNELTAADHASAT